MARGRRAGPSEGKSVPQVRVGVWCADEDLALGPLSPAFGRLGRRARTVMQSTMYRTPSSLLPFGEKSASGTGGFREVDVTSGFTKEQEAG